MQQLTAARAARDWTSIRKIIDGFSATDDRYVAAGVAAQAGDEDFYAAVLVENPGDPLAMLLLAEALVRTGWKIRSSARASQVSREQFRQLHEYLRRAESTLIELAAVQPQRAETWTLRLTTAMGLQLDLAEARRRYDRAVRCSPHSVAAQRSLLQKLLPKWSGSWEQAETFARDCVAQAPDCGANVVLIVDLHLERLLDLPDRQHQEYVARPQVRAEIMQAALRGPLTPQFRPGLYWKSVYNHFALMLALVGETAAAAHCFRVLDGHVSEYPWAYFGDPVHRFAHDRGRTLGRE